MKGAPLFQSDSSEVEEVPAAASPTSDASSQPLLQARLIGQGYKQVRGHLHVCKWCHESPTVNHILALVSRQVCGRSDAWGDGVVPEESAHLEGALNLVLDGVYHSPVGATEARPWYGSPSILAQWIEHLED